VPKNIWIFAPLQIAKSEKHMSDKKEFAQTAAENCQMLCRDCNRRKSDI